MKLHVTLSHAVDEAKLLHDTVARLLMSEDRLCQVVDALPKCDVLGCKRIATRHDDREYLCAEHDESGLPRLPGPEFEKAVHELEKQRP